MFMPGEFTSSITRKDTMTDQPNGFHHYLKEHSYWKPAIVMRRAETDRSYHIITAEGGQEYRRNRRRLLNIKDDTHIENNSDHTQCSTTSHTAHTARETTPLTVPYKTR